MKVIVTHMAPDWDAISSVWLLKKFLAGWQQASVEFVPAGQRSDRVKNKKTEWEGAVEKLGDLEIIQVDTGMGPLDHHQTQDHNVSAASRTWDYVQEQLAKGGDAFAKDHQEAI